MILAMDNEAILPAVKKATDEGIPVIAYDRLIESPNVLYITFDNVGVGRMMAKAILKPPSPPATTPSSRATRATRTPTSCSPASRKSSARR